MLRRRQRSPFCRLVVKTRMTRRMTWTHPLAVTLVNFLLFGMQFPELSRFNKAAAKNAGKWAVWQADFRKYQKIWTVRDAKSRNKS